MKRRTVLLMAFLPILLAGCAFNAGIDTLLTPPKLTDQQEHIYSALKKYTGPDISLKYPKSGNNLSAFIVEDIDGDKEDEAVVFYKKNTAKPEDASLRINILDNIDSGWQSVYDHAIDGNEIEQVDIARLGASGRVSIIAGYSLINRNEKEISIYDYAEGKLSSDFENIPYSVFDTADLDGDGADEIFTAGSKTASRDASASVYHRLDDGTYKSSSVILSDLYTDYSGISYSTNYNGETTVFLDAETGNGSVATEVLAVNSRNELYSVFTPDIEKNETVRPSAYLSMDIDGDGKTEIPVPHYCEGCDENSEDPVFFTSWYQISEKKLKHKYESWFSITDGYIFIFPDEWYGKVSAKTDISENEVTLFRYDKGAGEEIFTVKAVSAKQQPTITEDSGYRLLHSRGDRLFFVKINKESSLVKSPEEIIMKFRFRD